MSQFIDLTDYDASIHAEILDALTRKDPSLVEICEDRAIAEARCYLSRRYDCDAIFGARGDERNQLAIYHTFCIHNPYKLSPIRKERYERAVEWLKMIAAEELSIEGAPMLPEEERTGGAMFKITSNPRRVSHM